jgi:hypothetical protein
MQIKAYSVLVNRKTMNQFKIQNSKLNTATHKGWGFYLPWDTRTVSPTIPLGFEPNFFFIKFNGSFNY